ncbi:tail fiber protein, partial [Salmonella enterica subsp. enterica serovar Anatum]|nr:tail fiber protein [Salmonella enterica subsp. enterica serovar Anatum]
PDGTLTQKGIVKLNSATDSTSTTEAATPSAVKAAYDKASAAALLWSTLGQSLMKHGEWQEATLAFRAALKQRPDAYDYAWLADA